MAQSFGSWLKAQQHRDDDVGDFAQDFLRDIKRTIYRRPSDWTPNKLWWRMKGRGASAIALSVWHQARNEWKSR